MEQWALNSLPRPKHWSRLKTDIQVKWELKGDATQTVPLVTPKKIEAMRRWTPQLLFSHFPATFCLCSNFSPSSSQRRTRPVALWILGSASLPLSIPLRPYSTGHSLCYCRSPVMKPPPRGRHKHPKFQFIRRAPSEEAAAAVGRKAGSGILEGFWEGPGQLQEPRGITELGNTPRPLSTGAAAQLLWSVIWVSYPGSLSFCFFC